MGRKIFAKPVHRNQGVASYAGDGLCSLFTSTVQVRKPGVGFGAPPQQTTSASDLTTAPTHRAMGWA